MPEEVTFDEKAKLIRVRGWGIDTIEDWLSSKGQVLHLHEEHGAERLLVDVRDVDTAPSITDIFEFGSGWQRGIRVAILVGEKTAKEHEFLETVAVNRAKEMRVFDDEEDALNWLLR